MTGNPPDILAVLFDRDDTLIADVPYNGDPELVRPMPTAARTLDRLRELGVAVGVVSNQSGIARGLLSEEQVRRVNARVDALLGPFDVWRFCPHAPIEGCECRKPRPGMVLSAAEELGIPVDRVAVIGDIGADVEAARAAGARSVLVPTRLTQQREIDDAPAVARTLWEAAERLVPELRESESVASRAEGAA